MERRDLLAVGAAAGAVGLSGCAGLLSSETGSNDAAESVDAGTQESTPSQGSGEQMAVADVLRNYYQEGHEPYTRAGDVYADARDRYDAEEYLEAVQQFERAAGLYESATGFFEEAVFLARDREYSAAEQVASEAARFCTQRRLACQQYASAAIAYERGNADRGESVESDADGHRDDASQYTVVPVEEFDRAVQSRDGDG